MDTEKTPLTLMSAQEPVVDMKAQRTEPLWTVNDVARYLRLEPETVRNMAREGKLPAIKVGRVWRFKANVIKNWVVMQG